MSFDNTPTRADPDAECRPVAGYEGLYSVTRDGRVWSHPKRFARTRHGGLWLKPGLNDTGYLVVVLAKDGVHSTQRVHRLVALAWLPKPAHLNVINHINGISTDNRVENLEWCTQAHNVAHAHLTGLNKTRRVLSESRLADVRAAIAAGMQGKHIAAKFGINQSMVSSIKTGKYAERKNPPINQELTP